MALAPADQARVPTTFTVQDGEVFRGAIHMDPDDCALLLSAYERQIRAGDWWSPHARQRAAELAGAMAEAYHRSAA